MTTPTLNTHLTQDQHRMLDIYTAQYRQTNDQINQLYRYLDDIRRNINMVMFSNNLNTNNTNTMNSNTRNSNSNRRRTRESDQNIFYDYNNPINPSIYLDNLASYRIQNQNRNSSPFLASEMSGLLSNFLNSNVIVRPTNQQIENASRLVSYSQIQNPNSEACPISLERFNPNDEVRQINHCGHIFLPNEFNEWFHTNVRCPVCRYDIRNGNTESIRPQSNVHTTGATIGAAINAVTGNATRSEETRNEATRSESTRSEATRSEATISEDNITNVNVTRNPQTNIVDQVSFDISGNTITNDIVNTITNRLFESIFNPLTNSNNNDHFVYDPSNNILMYETIIHPNNNNNNNNNRRSQQ
jgi:hypothetical protein